MEYPNTKIENYWLGIQYLGKWEMPDDEIGTVPIELNGFVSYRSCKIAGSIINDIHLDEKQMIESQRQRDELVKMGLIGGLRERIREIAYRNRRVGEMNATTDEACTV